MRHLCPKCQRPQASAEDIALWKSRVLPQDVVGKLCFDYVESTVLLYEDEENADAATLRRKLTTIRIEEQQRLCGLLAIRHAFTSASDADLTAMIGAISEEQRRGREN